MSGSLAGRVAIVTGGARNIGRAIALELASAGSAVVVNARTSEDEAADVVRAIEASGGQGTVHLADVGDPVAVTGLIEATVREFGGIDILVNNAAIRRETSLDALEWREWREVLRTVLDGAYLCARAALPHLRKSNLASIVNIGGMSAHAGSSGRAHVVAAKAGLAGLTRALAHELGPIGITANCVVPGLVETQRGSSTGGSPAHRSIHRTLVGRSGTPQDIAGLVRFLSEPSGRYLTGLTIHANGGAYLT